MLFHIYALASLEQFRIMCDGIPDNKLCVSSPAFKALRRMARRKRGLTLTARCCMAMIALAGCAPLNLFAQQELVTLTSTTPATDHELPDAPGLGTPADGSAVEINLAPDPGTIAGTVLDPNGSVVEDARVVLTNRSGRELGVQPSGSNGEFTFPGLPAGTYKLTVTGQGMGKYVSPEILVHASEMRFVAGVVLPVSATTTDIRVSGNREELAQEQVQIAVEQRVLGVFPNFYSSYNWDAPPMGAKQKYHLAFRSVTDPVAFLGAGVLAGLEQSRKIFPGYGGGFQGYAKRYGATYANDASGRLLSSAVFPALFHQDPRYFYNGSGSISSRGLYALGATVISRGDNGRWQPNYSHILGCFAAGALSNLYYPSDSRGAKLTIVNGLVSLAGHAGNNILREFFLKGLTSKVPDYANGKPAADTN